MSGLFLPAKFNLLRSHLFLLFRLGRCSYRFLGRSLLLLWLRGFAGKLSFGLGLFSFGGLRLGRRRLGLDLGSFLSLGCRRLDRRGLLLLLCRLRFGRLLAGSRSAEKRHLRIFIHINRFYIIRDRDLNERCQTITRNVRTALKLFS